ncbi:MAG TPA: alpha/beta hydrolase family protein [Terriglobia bacterium]|nr:alpha/beta hydrolase family protein [Terriglobia bacterium]
MQTRRRDFLKTSLSLLAARGGWAMGGQEQRSWGDFQAYQAARRKELWGLLGDLPWDHPPGPAKLVKKEKHDGYTLERLILDLNGLEPVPALLLIPDRRAERAPGLLFIHWHAGMYDLGKEQLLTGTKVQPPYAPICAEKGLVTLAIDSWCFGERKHEENGHTGEEDAFKLMLWNGRVLYGMMMFDEFRAMDYLARRPEVDPERIGTMGMSMGATKAWWLAGLDPRVRLCIDICCLTEYQALIATHGLKEHGIYYYVPSLLKHFETATINELSVPRARLSVNGRRDPLTPPEGVERVRDHLMPLYRQYGKAEDCRIELYDCEHEETPAMRALILEWLDARLAKKT